MRHLIYIVLSLLLLASCNHKEFCYHHPHTAKVRMDVDWSQFDKDTPSGMTVMVYPQSGGDALHHLTNNTSYAIVDLEAGLYNTIVYNQSDTEFGSVSFVDMEEFSTAKVLLNDKISRWYASRSEEEKLAEQPEWIGTDFCTDVEVTPAMVEAETEEYMATIAQMSQTRTDFKVAALTPRNIIHTINVTVHLKGIYNVLSARASLTGLAEGYLFSEATPTESQVTHLFESWSIKQNPEDPTTGYLTASITSMGLPYGHGGTADENLFTLSLLLVDGETVVDIPFKVGDKLSERKAKSDKYTLELNLELYAEETLPDVPPAGAGGGGFNATVDDWGEEQNIDLGL